MKRRLIPILALLLALTPAAARAQSFPFSWTDESTAQYSLLLDEQGQPLTDPMEYSDIYAVDPENGWFAAHSVAEFGAGMDAYNLFYALMNAQGQALTEEKYSGLYAAYADRVIFMEPGAEDGMCRYGLLDASGREITPAAYTGVFTDGDTGFFATAELPDGNMPLYHLDHDGNAQDTGYLCPLYLFGDSTGPCPAQDPDTGLYGYLNSDAQWAISPQFSTVNAFDGGFALVSTVDSPELYGLIDATGRMVLACEFDWISVSEGGHIVGSRTDASGAGQCEVYDSTGALLFAYDGTVSDGYGPYFCGWPRDANGTELLDAAGNVVRSVSDSEGYFYSGSMNTLFFSDASDGLTYLMKDAFTPASPGYASLNFASSDGERALCLASEGRMVRDDEGDYWYPEWSSLRYGVIDGEGNVLIPAQFRQLYIIPHTSLFAFADDSGRGVIDASGNVRYYRSDYLDLVD